MSRWNAGSGGGRLKATPDPGTPSDQGGRRQDKLSSWFHQPLQDSQGLELAPLGQVLESLEEEHHFARRNVALLTFPGVS